MGNMVEREVVPERWLQFCERWGAAHRGWLVTLRVEGEEGAILARDRALRSVKLKGEQALTIGLDGHTPNDFEIDEITKICERLSDGQHAGLRVERAGAPPVLLSFRVPSLPEVLDGLAESER